MPKIVIRELILFTPKHLKDSQVVFSEIFLSLKKNISFFLLLLKQDKEKVPEMLSHSVIVYDGSRTRIHPGSSMSQILRFVF